MTETKMPTGVPDQLTGLARRLQNNPDFMAQVLTTYQKQERLSDQALVTYLDTTAKMLTRLALCKTPSLNSPEFAKQVRQIAAYTEIEAGRIANIVRQVENLQTLASRPETDVRTETTAHQLQLSKGLLAAARDRTEPQENDEEYILED